MKITRKILVVLVLAAVVISCVALGASAANLAAVKTGEGMKFHDYNNVNFLIHDSFEGGVNDKGSSTASTGRGSEIDPTAVTIVTQKGGGAPYIYDTKKGATSSNSYVKLNYEKNNGALYLEPLYKTKAQALADSALTPVNGYVLEFDICSKSTSSNNTFEFNIQVMNTRSTNDGYISVARFKANKGTAIVAALTSSQSNISNGGATGSVTAAGVGKWIHVTIVYVPGSTADATGVIRVYANKAQEDRAGAVSRTCLGEFAASYNGNKVYPMGVRLGANAQKYGDLCIDNILYYQSSKVCDPNYIANLTPADVFINHVAAMRDVDISSVLRYESYLKATELRATVGSGSGNSSLQTAINNYNSFASSVAGLKAAAMNENLSSFKTKVQNIAKKKRGLSNIETRLQMISDADVFLVGVGELITRNEQYDDTVISLEKWREFTDKDKDIRTFVNRMTRFQNASTLDALQRHYNAATETYSVANDVHSQNYADFGNATEKTAITNAVNAYKNAETILGSKRQENNAQRFVELVNLFKDKTEADLQADTGVIKNQWYLARDILLEGNYKDTTEFNNAKNNIYERVNTFFFAKMMQEHVDILGAKLTVFDRVDANYVDKAGVCKFIDNYLERNAKDIDFNDSRIIQIKNTNTMLKTSLENLEIQYAAVLVENTKIFVGKMEAIASKTAYAELKPLFEEVTEFYYSMNLVGNEAAGIDTETVQNAANAYEALRTRLMNNEVYGAKFVLQMSDMPDAKYKDDHYAAFMECFKCDQFLDASYTPAGSEKSVGDYMAQYNNMKEAYENKSALANTESKTVIDAVCSVRTFCGIGELIAHVQNLLK